MSNSKTNSPQGALLGARKKVSDYIYMNEKDGKWSYHPNQEPSTEATAWCALSLPPEHAALPRALQFLANSQNKDGGWSTAPEEDKSDWCTGPALFALRSASTRLNDDKTKSNLDRGINYLGEIKTEIYSFGAKVILGALQGSKAVEESPRGWPWSKGCFHWVEPTSYNLYAMKLPEKAKYKSEHKQLVEKADQFLLENPCAAGGWNHGSHFSLGFNLPPFIVTTAEALLALQDYPTHKEIKRGFDFLDGQSSEAAEAGQQKSAMALSWMILANHAYGRSTDKLMAHLVAAQNKDGSFGPNLMVTALASMALGTADGVNPFKMKI